MHSGKELKEEAANAVGKKAVIGPDINLDEFEKNPVHHDYLREDALMVTTRVVLSVEGLKAFRKGCCSTFSSKR